MRCIPSSCGEGLSWGQPSPPEACAGAPLPSWGCHVNPLSMPQAWEQKSGDPGPFGLIFLSLVKGTLNKGGCSPDRGPCVLNGGIGGRAGTARVQGSPRCPGLGGTGKLPIARGRPEPAGAQRDGAAQALARKPH